jgi:hypothetical protein
MSPWRVIVKYLPTKAAFLDPVLSEENFPSGSYSKEIMFYIHKWKMIKTDSFFRFSESMSLI